MMVFSEVALITEPNRVSDSNRWRSFEGITTKLTHGYETDSFYRNMPKNKIFSVFLLWEKCDIIKGKGKVVPVLN
jgi:hypothetical protein